MDEKRCILHCWKCPKASNAFSLFLEKNSYNFTWKLLPLAWPQSYFCAELFSRMGLPEHTVSYPFFHLSPPPPSRLPYDPTNSYLCTELSSRMGLPSLTISYHFLHRFPCFTYHPTNYLPLGTELSNRMGLPDHDVTVPASSNSTWNTSTDYRRPLART